MKWGSPSAFILALMLSGIAYAEAPPATPAGVTLQSVRLGTNPFSRPITVYGSATGATAYVSDQDTTPGVSTCVDACAAEWPPVPVLNGAKASGDWSVIKRADGMRQWAHKGKPLYISTKDATPGEAKGLTAGWRVAAFQPASDLILPPGIQLLELPNAGGQALVDDQSMPLYITDADKKGAPTCAARPCTDLWRPFEAAQLARAMGDFTVVRRDDGLQQWAYRGKPLYTFSGDAISGDAKGDGLENKWHVALAFEYFMPQGMGITKNHFDGYNLADRAGKTLYVRDRVVGTQQGRSYRFGAHVNPAVGRILGLSTCDAVCTKTWKPLAAPKDAQASGYWEVAVRDDGARQWVYRGFPVYTYTGDTKPGDMKGIDTYEIMASNADPFSAADVGIKGAGAMVWHAVAP